MRGPFLAVDWGTTSRRVYLVENGSVIRREHDDRGVSTIAVNGFADEAAAIRARMGDLPLLMAGMVGANIGWRMTPDVPCPTGIDELAAAVLRIDARTVIVPGLSTLHNGRADVMRGEEVQLLGAVATGLAPADALLVQPGTHCKWAVMAGGMVQHFITAMTGELFGLVRAHGILAPQLGGSVTPGAAFDAGVRDGQSRDLAAALFGIRARSLLDHRDDADAAAYASGLLIGADVSARIAETQHEKIHILADPHLGALYAIAILASGREAVQVDSQSAFIAGIIKIGEAV